MGSIINIKVHDVIYCKHDAANTYGVHRLHVKYDNVIITLIMYICTTDAVTHISTSQGYCRKAHKQLTHLT